MTIREASQSDAARLVGLMAQIDFKVDCDGVVDRLDALATLGEPVLVAEYHGRVVGCLNWHAMTTLHRPYRVGRIVMLVVDEEERGRGIGTSLIAEAEARMRSAGCELMEVTSHRKLDRAHRYYERLGFVETSRRFGKEI